MLVVLRDYKVLIGYLRSVDQFGRLILQTLAVLFLNGDIKEVALLASTTDSQECDSQWFCVFQEIYFYRELLNAFT